MREVRYGLLKTCSIELMYSHDRGGSRYSGAAPFEAVSPLRRIFVLIYTMGRIVRPPYSGQVSPFPDPPTELFLILVTGSSGLM